MARIRQIEVKNFRSISSLVWHPRPGINCLVGPGDSGKSTILDAIDLCLGARRAAQFSDSDFHQLNVEEPISISVTVGELSDALKSMDAYGLYPRTNSRRALIADMDIDMRVQEVRNLRHRLFLF